MFLPCRNPLPDSCTFFAMQVQVHRVGEVYTHQDQFPVAVFHRGQHESFTDVFGLYDLSPPSFAESDFNSEFVLFLLRVPLYMWPPSVSPSSLLASLTEGLHLIFYLRLSLQSSLILLRCKEIWRFFCMTSTIMCLSFSFCFLLQLLITVFVIALLFLGVFFTFFSFSCCCIFPPFLCRRGRVGVDRGSCPRCAFRLVGGGYLFGVCPSARHHGCSLLLLSLSGCGSQSPLSDFLGLSVFDCSQSFLQIC